MGERKRYKMNVYRILGIELYKQVHCVVAESFAKAEEIWKENNGGEPKSIELYSDYLRRWISCKPNGKRG